MKPRSFSRLTIILIISFIIAACGNSGQENNSTANNGGNNNSNNNSNIQMNEVNSTTNDNSNSDVIDEAPGLAPLPPEQQIIETTLNDGTVLEGLYYPANVNPAPVIVLFHMNRGSRRDFGVIAPWLQYRDPVENEGFLPYLDNTWFPELPEDASFGVFAITFGGLSGARTDYPLEALTAVQTASTLDGVDPDQISTMGASVGADSAASSCYQFNQLVAEGSAEGKCQGSFSLSPGNYLLGGEHLTETFAELIAGQQDFSFPVTIYCLASEDDGNTAETCLSGQQDGVTNYSTIIYAGSTHGLNLIKDDITPADPESELNTFEIYLQFLDSMYGLGIDFQ